MAAIKFVSYLRVSTDKQGRSGLGLEAQRESVSRYLNGGQWKLVAEYVEVESGKRNSRPQLQAAISHAKATGAKLVIARLDRLARNLHFVSSLQERGVDFVAADMPDANRLTIHIIAAVAESVGRTISENTRTALAAAKARGVKLGNPPKLPIQSRADWLGRRCHGQSWFVPALSSFAITASRLKLAGFCRTGNSLKLCSHCLASACIGT